MELTNCSKCGTVFARHVIDLCPTCYREEEAAFQTVFSFLQKRKNRQATLQQIVEATEVEEDLIIKFLKQNRLQASQFPSLAYPCEVCGEPISEDKLCQDCSQTMLTKWSEASEEVKQHSEEGKQPIYYTMNKKLK